MLSIFIYGLGWTFLLSSIFGYDVPFIYVLFLSFLGFLVTITIFGNKKRSLISLSALALISGSTLFIMYLLGNKNLIFDSISTFILPYFESITNEATSIDIPRQIAIIFLLSLIIYMVLLKNKASKFSGHAYILLSLIALSSGFVVNRLNSMTDRFAFIFFIFCSILYYFHIYYCKNKQEEKKGALPFINIAIIYTLCIIGISQMLFRSIPYPFQAKVKTVNPNSVIKITDPYEKFVFEVAKSGNIKDEFTFEGIELFELKTRNTEYLKSIVYDTYTHNKWSQSETLQTTENRIYNSFEEIGEMENVIINYTGIKSPILFVAPYIDNISVEDSDIIISHDETRGTYRIENYTSEISKKDIVFSFDSLNINNTSSFKETLREVKLRNSLPQYEGYDNERLKQLALSITEGLNNDYDKIEAIIKYLKENYTYNPIPKVPKDESDKIEHFLFESKEGFCQHYSSAAVLLLRSINIPSRYVTGFKVDTTINFNSGAPYYKSLNSGYRPVYDSDAHAWIEVYFKGYGWVMFESTGIYVMSSNVNESLQEDEIEAIDEHTKASQETIAVIIKILLYVGLPIVLGLLIYMTIRIRKSKNAFRKGNASYKVKTIHKIVLEYLSASKLPKKHYETPLEYAKRIDATGIVSEFKYSDLILTYNKIVYGGYGVETNFIDIYFDYLCQIKRAVRKDCKLYKRVKLFFSEFINT
ncbi:MAG: hypothetical protein GX270_08755 [Clostridiaceae bacterium]|jgi:cbb3-type cytochrome oxidase subunit 3|nr:hypothetical protein [Clostridiaceae bacterium]